MKFVIQYGYDIFGHGDTEEEAIVEAKSNGLDGDTSNLPHFAGSVPSRGGKLMTNHGELHDGQIIVCDIDDLERLGHDGQARELGWL